MTRVFNFSAGPGTLPEDVLLLAADEMLDWHGSGQSVMEMSHRGKDYISIAEAAEADLRTLLAVPDGYHVLFLQGGASMQFEMIPMNLIQGRAVADYIHTGEWAKKAINAARGLADVNVVASAEDRSFSYVPAQSEWQLSDNAAYLHYTANETIGGVEFGGIPDVGDVPVVSDMSSNLLSRPLDVSRLGLIYAGAQKNIGPAGLTLVIIREDLIGIGEPGIGESLHALVVGLAAAHDPDVPDAGVDRAHHGRHVELGVVGEDADGVATAERLAAFVEQRTRP